MEGLGPGARLIIGAGIVLLGGVLYPMLGPAGVVGGAVTIELFKVFAGVAAGTIANAGDVLVGKNPTDPVSLENHDLTKAVGKAIATAIREAAKEDKYKQNSSDLNKIATYAENNWVKIAKEQFTQENYSQLREANLDQFLTPEEYRLTQKGNLSDKDWENIFTDLCESYKSSCAGQTSAVNDPWCSLVDSNGDSDFQLSSDISSIAKSLYEKFPKALQETFKQDFKQDGKAFARLILNLLTGMKAEIEKQGNQQTVEFTKILDHINKLEYQLKGTPAQIQHFFNDLSTHIDVSVAKISEELGIMKGTQNECLENGRQILQLLQKDPYFSSSNPPIQPDRKNHLLPNDNLDFYYIERPPLEQTCYDAIVKPGGLIRITAPQKMGKTLLLTRALNYAVSQGYQTVEFDVDEADLDNYETLLKSFCSCVSDDLTPKITIDEFWKEGLGIHRNYTKYFEEILLPQIENGLVIAIDSFDILFEFEDFFREFCRLIRSWYGKARRPKNKNQAWKKLRIVIVYSTQLYPKLDQNHSPLNVGDPIKLKGFTQEQAEIIVKTYQLEQKFKNTRDIKEFKLLIKLFDGHPYLIKLVLHQLKNQNKTIEDLCLSDSIFTEEGIFGNYLRELLEILENNPSLQEAYKKVIESNTPVRIEPSKFRYQLHSLGLIKFSGNNCQPSCELYRKYFKDILVNN